MHFAWILCAAAAAAAPTVTVQTTLGPIIGTAANDTACAAFYGVPYAAPPLGTNRFRPPQPAKPWVSPRPAFKVGLSCLQTFGDSFVNVPEGIEKLLEKYHVGMEPMGEDCLFLNVFTPEASA